MEPIRWQKIEELFNASLALPEEQREKFLDEACGADSDLRREVDSLVSAVDDRDDDFLSNSAFTLGTQLLAYEQSHSLSGQAIGAYTIIKPIGHGGMGEVYLARDERLGRKVAIKLLPVSLLQQEERVRRFKHEARAASVISHPNVAHIYEIGEANGRLFTAMEFVDGITLRERLSRETLKLGEAVDIATQVALAIEAAHAQGIVHRDIKPENIMIGRGGLVKVVDFGLAKLTDIQPAPNQDSRQIQTGPRLTQTLQTEPGILMGTPNYMSPEQARGREIDTRTDIWSWGVVFYEMITGQQPFRGATNSDVIAEILKSDAPLLRSTVRSLPQSLIIIFRKSLSKNKDERYPSMSDLLRNLGELRRHIEDQGQLASTFSSIELQSSEAPARSIAVLGFRDLLTKGQTVRWSSMLYVCAGLLLIVALSFVFYGLIGGRSNSQRQTIGPLQITSLTNDGRAMDAAVSADGRLIAYVSIEAGKQSLWLQELESAVRTQLLPPDPALCWGLRFAPNGQSLFYITTQPGSTVSVLYRLPVRGGPSQRVVANIDAPPALSPDGMQIAFLRVYPAQRRDVLIIANVDGSDEREIYSRSHPDKFSLSGISWSSDGKLIALGAGRNNETEFAVLGVPVYGGVPVELTPWQWTAVRGVAWGSAGSMILSARARGSRSLNIWRVSYPEGTVKRITSDENDYEEVSLSHNERVLVTQQTYEVSSIWTSDPLRAPRPITSGGHEGADGLAVTRQGRIIYTVGEYHDSSLWSMNEDGTDPRHVIPNNGALPSTSKEGHLIAYVSSDGNARHIWLTDLDGENNRQLTNGGGEHHPSITPDGRWVVYTSFAEQRGTLWKVSTAGGPPIQLTHAGLTMRPVVSPDGTKIACTYRTDETDKWKIAVLPFIGGSPLRTFALPFPFNQVIRWTPDSNALLYMDKRDGVTNIWRQPLDGSAAAPVTNFTEDLILHYDLLNRDSSLVFARGGRRRDVTVIKNF